MNNPKEELIDINRINEKLSRSQIEWGKGMGRRNGLSKQKTVPQNEKDSENAMDRYREMEQLYWGE